MPLTAPKIPYTLFIPYNNKGAKLTKNGGFIPDLNGFLNVQLHHLHGHV